MFAASRPTVGELKVTASVPGLQRKDSQRLAVHLWFAAHDFVLQNSMNNNGMATEIPKASGNQLAWAENEPNQQSAAAIPILDSSTAGQNARCGSFFMPISNTLASAMIGSDLQTTRQMMLERLSSFSSFDSVLWSLNRRAIGRPNVAPIQ